jgi:hypothetical protein
MSRSKARQIRSQTFTGKLWVPDEALITTPRRVLSWCDVIFALLPRDSWHVSSQALVAFLVLLVEEEDHGAAQKKRLRALNYRQKLGSSV